MLDDTYETTVDDREEMTTPFEFTLAHAYLTEEVLRWQEVPAPTVVAVVGPYLPDKRAWVLSISRAGDAWTWDTLMDVVEGSIYFRRLDEDVSYIRAEYHLPAQPGVPVAQTARARCHPIIDWATRITEGC